MSVVGIPPSDEVNERNSDNEPSLVGDDIDKYSNKGESPRRAEASAPAESKKSIARFELGGFDVYNPRLQQLFLQGDYVECKSLIGELINQYGDDVEFALYIRGIIARIEGQLEEAIIWFEKARESSANNYIYDIELGRVSLLLGRQTNAVDYLERAIKANPTDARSYYWLARAIYHLDTDLFNPVEKSRDLLVRAPVIQNNSTLIIFLGKVLEELNERDAAAEAYKRAIELEPDNLDVMHKLGMLYLRGGDEDRAFAQFGNALSRDPTHAGCILAMGSIMQAHGDHDTALSKYRVAAELCDYNGCLWNNIGMCLFARGKLAAAHSCLKKASFISPLDYKTNYNLGLVHEAMGLYCSALHFLKKASDLKRNNPHIIGAMAVVLSKMSDFNNARRAYQRSIEIEPLINIVLNYAIFEFNQEKRDASRTALAQFRAMANAGPVRQDLLSQASRLEEMLLEGTTPQAPSA